MFYKRERIGKLNPEFWECPTACKYDKFDSERKKFCDDCDHRIIEERFEKFVNKKWKERLGDKSVKFSLEKMTSFLYQVLSLEDLPADKMSVKTKIFIDAYNVEKNRYEQIKDWQDNQNS